MPILDKKETELILKVENFEKGKGKLVAAAIIGTFIVLVQATKDILFGFTKYKLIDAQTLALENAIFWIFILGSAVYFRNRNKKFIQIIRKLIDALEGGKTEGTTKECK